MSRMVTECGPGPKTWPKLTLIFVVPGGSGSNSIVPRTGTPGGTVSGQSPANALADSVLPPGTINWQLPYSGRDSDTRPLFVALSSTLVYWSVTQTWCTVSVSCPAFADFSATRTSTGLANILGKITARQQASMAIPTATSNLVVGIRTRISSGNIHL